MSEYSDVQQWFTALSVLPCVAICVFLYKYAKQRLQGTQVTQAERMKYWYCLLAGGTTGLFFCHTLRKSLVDSSVLSENNSLWGYSVLIGFVLITFYLIWSMYRFRLISIPEDNETENMLDRDHMVQRPFLESTDVTSEEYSNRVVTVQDEDKRTKLRRRVSLSFYAVMLLLIVIEGMYLVYRQDVAYGGPATLIACWWIDCAMKTIIVCAILIHGNIHTMENNWHRLFWVLCAVWCICILLSTIPVLTMTTTETIQNVVDFWLLGIVHACAGGFLFYISTYFTARTQYSSKKKELIFQLSIWLTACLIFYITGIFV